MSVLLALLTIALLLLLGAVIVLTYLEATEDAPVEAGQDPYIVHPMVDLGAE